MLDTDTRRNNIINILLGLVWTLGGLALIIWNKVFLVWVYEILALLVTIKGIVDIFRVIFMWEQGSDKNRLLQLFTGVGHLVFAWTLTAYEDQYVHVLIYAIGTYQILMGIINLISYLLLLQDQVGGRFSRLLFALVNLIFGITSFTAEPETSNALLRLGIYSIFVGLTYLNDGRGLVMDPDKTEELKRRFRFPVPVIFSALLPHRALRRINEFIEDELHLDEDFKDNYTHSLLSQEEGYDSILKVYIHTSQENFDILGHVSISYQGLTYSYGNHDVDSGRLLRAIGDGVLAKVDSAEYIAFCLSQGATIFEYSIVLNAAQTEALEAKLQEIDDLLIPWQPSSPTQLAAYVGKAMRATNAQFYKFRSGKFKTYYVFWTNCVLLADEIIGSSGLDLFVWVGIMTPGTYYEYMEKEYHKVNSIVVDRKVYNPDLMNLVELPYLDYIESEPATE